MERLIETSVWVEFTRRSSTAGQKAAVMPWINDPDAVICEPVVFEVLRNATAAERRLIETKLFATLPVLPLPPDFWERAATLGQECRASGYTAGSIDLLIAAIALHYNAEVVTLDADYLEIAKASPLKVRFLQRG